MVFIDYPPNNFTMAHTLLLLYQRTSLARAAAGCHTPSCRHPRPSWPSRGVGRLVAQAFARPDGSLIWRPRDCPASAVTPFHQLGFRVLGFRICLLRALTAATGFTWWSRTRPASTVIRAYRELAVRHQHQRPSPSTCGNRRVFLPSPHTSSAYSGALELVSSRVPMCRCFRLATYQGEYPR
jgi:hypothetical protein